MVKFLSLIIINNKKKKRKINKQKKKAKNVRKKFSFEKEGVDSCDLWVDPI